MPQRPFHGYHSEGLPPLPGPLSLLDSDDWNSTGTRVIHPNSPTLHGFKRATPLFHSTLNPIPPPPPVLYPRVTGNSATSPGYLEFRREHDPRVYRIPLNSSAPEIDLAGAQLSGVKLRHKSFVSGTHTFMDCTHGDLTGCSFNDADVRQSRFDHANLTDVDFRFANIQEATFHGATLTNTYFTGEQLQTLMVQGHRHFVGVCLMNANLIEWDASGGNFPGADFSHSDLSFADISLANTEGAKFTGATLRNTRVNSHQFRALISEGQKNFNYLNLEGCYLRRVDLSGLSLAGARLVGADLRGAILENTTFEGAKFFDFINSAPKDSHEFKGLLSRLSFVRADPVGSSTDRSHYTQAIAHSLTQELPFLSLRRQLKFINLALEHPLFRPSKATQRPAHPVFAPPRLPEESARRILIDCQQGIRGALAQRRHRRVPMERECLSQPRGRPPQPPPPRPA